MAKTSSTDRTVGLIYKANSRGPRAWLSRLAHWRPLRDFLRVYYMLRLARYAEESPRESRIPTIFTPATPADVDGLTIRGPSWTVGDFVPVGFEAYAWLPNPIWMSVPPGTGGAIANEESGGDGGRWRKPMKWSEVAAAHGVTMTKDTELHEIEDPRGSRGGERVDAGENRSWYPSEGTLEPFIADPLFSILSRETGAGDTCLVGQWEGSSSWHTHVKLLTPHWNYLVWRASFGDLADWLRQPDSFERSMDCPHIIWPRDRRWCLATLYSGFSNYLAGPRTLIDAVLSSDLEAYESELSNQAT